MNGRFKVFDADFHVMEPAAMWKEYIDPKFRDRAPTGAKNKVQLQYADGKWAPTLRHRSKEVEEGWEAFLAKRDRRYKDPAAANYDGPSHLKAMDVEGVDLSVNFPSQGLYAASRNDMDGELALAICRAYNDWLADLCKNDPKRLFGAAMVPQQDVDLAIAEADRAVKKLGMKAVYVRAAPILGRSLGHPFYEPLWAHLEKLGVPVATHEAYGSYLAQIGEDRYDSVVERRAVVHPMEQMSAVMSMIYGGVFERHPKLQCAYFECGASWIPYWLTRLDEQAEVFHHELKGLHARPSEYFKRNCWVSTECEDTTVKYAIDFLEGADRILFSTDYPHPDGLWPNATKIFLKLPGVSDADKAKILWENPLKLYGMKAD